MRHVTAKLASQSVASIVDEMVRRIVEQHDPDRIILFGSRARDTAQDGSDVDLLVVLPNGTPRRPTTVEIYRVLAGIGVPKDIIVATIDDIEKYRHLPGTVIREALREGRVLYERTR